MAARRPAPSTVLTCCSPLRKCLGRRARRPLLRRRQPSSYYCFCCCCGHCCGCGDCCFACKRCGHASFWQCRRCRCGAAILLLFSGLHLQLGGARRRVWQCACCLRARKAACPEAERLTSGKGSKAALPPRSLAAPAGYGAWHAALRQLAGCSLAPAGALSPCLLVPRCRLLALPRNVNRGLLSIIRMQQSSRVPATHAHAPRLRFCPRVCVFAFCVPFRRCRCVRAWPCFAGTGGCMRFGARERLALPTAGGRQVGGSAAGRPASAARLRACLR